MVTDKESESGPVSLSIQKFFTWIFSPMVDTGWQHLQMWFFRNVYNCEKVQQWIKIWCSSAVGGWFAVQYSDSWRKDTVWSLSLLVNCLTRGAWFSRDVTALTLDQYKSWTEGRLVPEISCVDPMARCSLALFSLVSEYVSRSWAPWGGTSPLSSPQSGADSAPGCSDSTRGCRMCCSAAKSAASCQPGSQESGSCVWMVQRSYRRPAGVGEVW